MSDAGQSGDTKESFVEDENKVDIEETSVNLYCIKNEPNDEVLDFIEDRHPKRYTITLEYENLFGEPSQQREIKEDYDNLIGFLDNDVIMETAMIKLEAIKEEDDGSFNNFHCSKCKGIYKGYCLKCSTLLHILNNNFAFVNSGSKSNTTPTDILEIRETCRGKGVYLLRTLPINIIFGPFEGILGIESTVGHSWKMVDNKLRNFKSGNWMKNIVCAPSASLKNLDIFQNDGNLYFQTKREITEGEELFIYYDDKELQQLDNSEECLYSPQKQEKLPKIFACTICCLGFGSHKCLMEHKGKCRVEHSRSMKHFILVECHYCKMWIEKWEHEEHHIAYCFEKHHRMSNEYSEAVYRSDANVVEIDDGCDMKYDKVTYQRDICSRSKDRKDDLQFDTKDFQSFSGGNQENRLNESTLAGRSNNEQIQNTIETDNKSRLRNRLNKRKGVKEFQCDICKAKFTQKNSITKHIKNKHRDERAAKNYKCSECSFHTNYRRNIQRHLKKHKGIKQFQCDICKVKFTRKSNLNTHIKNRHTDDDSAKVYKCSKCSYQSNHKYTFQNHQKTHSGIKPFKCDICTMTFTAKGNLKMHIKNRHAAVKDYKCSECFYQTNYKYQLEQHLNKHKGIKPYKCDICIMKFRQKGQLKVHIKNWHTEDGGVKDYKCSQCFYQTNQKANLEKHLNKHKGIKPFECDICMAKFTEKGNLKIHIKNKHTNYVSAKDYKCSECSYQSNHKGNFQSHLNKHKDIKPFKCDICMKDFGRKVQLQAHIKDKHTDNGSAKDYKCSECSYQTNHKGNFQTHLKQH